MSLSIIANVVSRYAASTRTAGLKEVTFKEFQQALANAGWPSPEYAHTKRTMDAYYKDRGTEVAHKTQILTRGKVTQEHFYANPDYLGERKGEDVTAGRHLSAADYSEYVKQKKREGEKPLDRKEWEARVEGKGKGSKLPSAKQKELDSSIDKANDFLKEHGKDLDPDDREEVEWQIKKVQQRAEKGDVYTKELDSLIKDWEAQAKSRKTAATNIVVLDDDDLEGLDEKAKKAWKGYTYKMTYEVVSPESAEEGDAEDRGWEEEGSEPYDTLEEVLKAVDDKSWLEWSSSSPDGKRDWIISQAEEDYSSGNNTTYNLWIERKDGKPLGKEELAYIKKSLRLH